MQNQKFYLTYPIYGDGGRITTMQPSTSESERTWTCTANELEGVGLDVQKALEGDYEFNAPKSAIELLRRRVAKW